MSERTMNDADDVYEIEKGLTEAEVEELSARLRSLGGESDSEAPAVV